MPEESFQLQGLYCCYIYIYIYMCPHTTASVCEGVRRDTCPQKAEAASTRKSSVSRTWGAAAAEAARIGRYTKQISRNAPQAGIHQRYHVCKTAVYTTPISRRICKTAIKKCSSSRSPRQKRKKWGHAGNVGQRSKMSNMRAALSGVYRLLALSSQDDNWRCWMFVLFHGFRFFIWIS